MIIFARKSQFSSLVAQCTIFRLEISFNFFFRDLKFDILVQSYIRLNTTLFHPFLKIHHFYGAVTIFYINIFT